MAGKRGGVLFGATALAALLTLVHAAGLLGRTGVDSLVVLIRYVLGVGGLFAIAA